MKNVRPNPLVTVLLTLVIWGPPRIRLEDRDASVALENPLDLDAAAIFQVATVVLAAIAAAIMILHLKKATVKGTLKKAMQCYILLGILAVVSTVYSPNPLYTAFFSARFLVAIALPIAFIARGGPRSARTALHCVRFVAIYQTLAILGIGAFAPDLVGTTQQGLGYRLNGGPLGDYGISAAVWLIFLTVDFLHSGTPSDRLIKAAIASLPLTYLYFARSRTTLIACLAACMLVAAMRRPGKVTIAAIGMTAMLAIALGTGTFAPIESYLRRGQTNAELETLSGRTQVFSFLIDEWRANPIFGSGYAAGSRVSLLRYMNETNSSLGAAHDILSRSLVDLGLIGALLVGLTSLFAVTETAKIIITTTRTSVAPPRHVTLAGGIIALDLILGIASGGIMDASCSLVIALAVLNTGRQAATSPQTNRSALYRPVIDARTRPSILPGLQ